MKKLFYFAAAAMMMAACTSEELNVQDQQKLVEDNAAVNFDVYAQRGVTRAGAAKDITNTTIQTGIHKDVGFGVFAYYTDGKQYDTSAIPNFMYNQQVKYDGTKWTYEPVKYWPNEFGDAAKADEVDYLTFFAYAPWTQLVPTTGKPDVAALGLNPSDDVVANYQTKNIIQVTDNKKTGDPIIKYVVDTDPETSVDLLWGVNADATGWAPIQAQTDAVNTEGLPFLNLTKPVTPFDAAGGKIKFNLRHALAKVKITIDYIADDNTPDPSANYNPANANKINDDQTRIFVRWIEMNGFALEGALNLNNTEANKPLWKDFNNNELNFDEIRFNDGRKDGKEGTENGTAKEANMYLNPEIVENFAVLDNGKFAAYTAATADAEAKGKTPGVKPFVKDDYKTAQLLFGGDPNGDNEGFFYVIPRNSSTDGQGGEGVNIKINYGVLTIDPSLATTLSGTKDFGSEVENQIYKEDIFGTGFDFEAGKQYEIHIHLGMTSVKIDAVVTDWEEGKATDVDLPDNQPEGAAEPASTGANANNIVVGTVFKFASTWDPGYTASAKIMAVSGKIVTIKVTGCAQAEANGTYYVNIDDFDTAITPAADENPAKLNANAEEIPVYKTADDATNKTNYLFKVSIKKNSEE